jgi:hypothetical protein
VRTSKERYVSLADTIQKMGMQVYDSLDYADKYLPYNVTPKEIFHILKQNTTYKHDPQGVELLQSMPSLMDDNYWGHSGWGDCDCFTIAGVACCTVRGYKTRYVVVGNDRNAPSHIYFQVHDGRKWVDFDLVAPYYGITKPYKYQNSFPIIEKQLY